MKATTETITELLAASDHVGRSNLRLNERPAWTKGKFRQFIRALSEMFGG